LPVKTLEKIVAAQFGYQAYFVVLFLTQIRNRYKTASSPIHCVYSMECKPNEMIQKVLFSSLLLLLIMTSCKKEKIVEIRVPIKRSWSLDSSLFGSNKILLTSFPLNDSVLAVANSNLVVYVNINQIDKPVSGAYINLNPPFGYLLAPRISESIGVTLLNSSQMKVFNTLYPVSNFGSFIYTPSYLGSANSTKSFLLPAFPQSGYPVIRSKYILAPTEIDYPIRAYASLLTVKLFSDPVTNPQLNGISLVDAKPITLDPAPTTLGFAIGTYYSTAYFDKFFLYLAQQFYRIDTLGNVKAFGFSPQAGVENGRVTQMFTLDNVLFAGGFEKLFVSGDQGETWSLFANVMGTQFEGLIYFNIGSELYATYQSQLWRVTLSGSNLNYQELDNDGLQGSQITSMNKVGKYVFITTLSGLFYREFSSLNTPRK
jgi:hypothetical protein